MQAELYPLKVKSCDPANLGSADADLICMASNGMYYVVKTQTKTPNAPAAEWFCHLLAKSCGIAVPQIDVLQLKDNSLG